MSLRFNSQAAQGTLTAQLDPPRRTPPDRILLRFRHPDAQPIRRVDIDGKPWTRFDPQREWVELPPLESATTITAHYDTN